MADAKRWCGRAAAGSETAAMNPMVEWHGDPDEDTSYVLASDYDALEREVVELRGALYDERLVREIAMQVKAYEPISQENVEQLLADIRSGILIYAEALAVDAKTPLRRAAGMNSTTEPPIVTHRYRLACVHCGYVEYRSENVGRTVHCPRCPTARWLRVYDRASESSNIEARAKSPPR